ncbi:hypothetical protein EIP91_004857 [Steccherinum ochraceum]|uniref:Uncharacterized protein n=1 Tax=Steccherinum ochraceum TaxID=92696 RepID=A0A4R0RZT3_9APHY|nr:hypothetical protein EIP91_004857 [Steccherinum ochraceum]
MSERAVHLIVASLTGILSGVYIFKPLLQDSLEKRNAAVGESWKQRDAAAAATSTQPDKPNLGLTKSTSLLVNSDSKICDGDTKNEFDASSTR